jgi:hypothetical protein
MSRHSLRCLDAAGIYGYRQYQKERQMLEIPYLLATLAFLAFVIYVLWTIAKSLNSIDASLRKLSGLPPDQE